MYNPCFECFNRYGKQYTEECDNTCQYAHIVKELKDKLNAAIFAMHKIVTDDYEPCQFCLRPCDGRKYSTQVCYENGYEKFKWREY